MPTIPKKSIITKPNRGLVIAHTSETGTRKTNQVILDYSQLPRLFAFKDIYQGDDVFMFLETMFLDAVRSKSFNKRSEERQQSIIEFYDFLKGACFELLEYVDKP